jgi:hypothetical protein
VGADSTLANGPALVRKEYTSISDTKGIERSIYRQDNPVINGVADPATTLVKEVIHIGAGVNYDANRGVGTPQWVRTEPLLLPSGRAGASLEAVSGPLEFYLPSVASLPLAVKKNAYTLSIRLSGAAPSVPVLQGSDGARYDNVFQDTDLSWRVGAGSLKETLTLRSPQAPTEFYFSVDLPNMSASLPDRTGAGSISLDSLGNTPTRVFFPGPITIVERGLAAKGIAKIMEPYVIDARGNMEWLECHVARTASGFIYSMRVPNSFLSDPSLAYPLTIDPTIVYVPVGTLPLVYEAGKTYCIEGMIDYHQNEQVRIEANAILKYRPGMNAALRFMSGANMQVLGLPYNYAIFTSSNDNTVGGTVSGSTGVPNRDDYTAALVFYGGSQGKSRPVIQYAKIAYGFSGIYAIPAYGELDGATSHSVFRKCRYSALVYSHSVAINTFHIHNCLFDAGMLSYSYGIRTITSSSNKKVDLTVTNCTFAQFGQTAGYGIRLEHGGDASKHKIDIERNIFFACRYGVSATGQSFESGSQMRLNGFEECNFNYTPASGYSGFTLGAPLLDPNCQTFPYLYDLPFGAFCLNPISAFRDAGVITTAFEAGLSTRTTNAPTAANGRLIATAIEPEPEVNTACWVPIERDVAYADLGYHYDPVDYVIRPSGPPDPYHPTSPNVIIPVNCDLTIAPGVTVAFAHDAGNPDDPNRWPNVRWVRIEVDSQHSLALRGTAAQPIRITSTLLAGDKLGVNYAPTPALIPGATSLYFGLQFNGSINASDLVDHAIFNGASAGIHTAYNGYGYLGGVLNISNCVFAFCLGGVSLDWGAPAAEVTNCLFLNSYGHSLSLYPTPIPAEVTNCTFANATAAGIMTQQYDYVPTIINCIFYGNGCYGIYQYLYDPENPNPPNENWNAFYNNVGGSANFEISTGDDIELTPQEPLFSASSAPEISERYYLDQASRCCNHGYGVPYGSTALNGSWDKGQIDIGYHYPMRWLGTLKQVTSPSDSVDDEFGPTFPKPTGRNYYQKGTYFGRVWQKSDGTILCPYVCNLIYTDPTDPLPPSPQFWYTHSRIGLRKWNGQDWEVLEPIYEITDSDMHDRNRVDEVPDPDDTVLVGEPYLIEVTGGPSAGALLCSFRQHTYEYDEQLETGKWSDFRIRVLKLPAGQPYETASWIGPLDVQIDNPAPGANWSWPLWDSSLLELSNHNVICFFTREGRVVEYDDQWPWFTDSTTSVRQPYGAARIFDPSSLEVLAPGTPPWNGPIIVCSNVMNEANASLWRQNNGDGTYSYINDPDTRWLEAGGRSTGMTNAVLLPDHRILGVFESLVDPAYETICIGSVKSTDTNGWVWELAATGLPPYPRVYSDKIPDGVERNNAAPNLISMSDGRIICAFTCDDDSAISPSMYYSAGAFHAFFWSDIKFVWSRNLGATWSAPELVVSQRGLGELVANCTFDSDSLYPWSGDNWTRELVIIDQSTQPPTTSWAMQAGANAEITSQPLPLENLKAYKVAFTMAGVDGVNGIRLGLYKIDGEIQELRDVSGQTVHYTGADLEHYAYYMSSGSVHNIPSIATERGIYIIPDGSFRGWVDNVSVVSEMSDVSKESGMANSSGLCPLNNGGAMCVFNSGPWGAGGFYDQIKSIQGGP